ncbi:MAG: FG-GAP-like repeat-containing protein [Ignavibacteria bacterium]
MKNTYILKSLIVIVMMLFSLTADSQTPYGLANPNSNKNTNRRIPERDPSTDILQQKIFTGEADYDSFGTSVSSAGDVNGDGTDDLIIGALRSASGSGTGRVYFYIGGPNMETSYITYVSGEASDNYFGSSVSSAGDVNNDGYDDIIIGAFGYGSGTGRAYIYYGGEFLDNVADVVMTGEANTSFGYSVSKAGDVNNDGYDDVIVSGDAYNFNTGKAYIFFGGAAMNNVADVTMTGEAAFDYFGRSVSEAGDVNGDGYDDVIIGARGFSSNTGRAYLYYGGTIMNNVADVIMTGEAAGNYFGYSVSGSGNQNGDGYSDVIVGAVGYGSNTGRAYVFYGSAVMNNAADVILTGDTVNSYFGNSVSGEGDVNGDGYSDVVAGAPEYRSTTGKAFVFFGAAVMNDVPDMTMTGEGSTNYLGYSVSASGDLNDDGKADIIIGAPWHSAFKGKAYVYSIVSRYWTTQSPMPFEKDLGTAVGYSRNDTGWIYTWGGEPSSSLLHRFNMRTNVWDAKIVMLSSNRLGSAILKDSIYSIGGSINDPNYIPYFLKYDINGDSWEFKASLPGNLGWGRGAGYQDSLIYVAGGHTGSTVLSQVLLYNAKTNSWRTATPMPEARFGGGFAISGDTLVYVDGHDGFFLKNSVFRGVINQTNRSIITWSSGAPPNFSMFRFDAHSWGNRGIIITGGSTSLSYTDVSTLCKVYSPGSDTWKTQPGKTLPITAGQSAVAVSNSALRLVAAGGYDGTATTDVTEMFTDSSVSFNTPVNINLILEGFYNPVSNRLSLRDTVIAYLRNIISPYAVVDSAKGVMDSLEFSSQFYFNNASTGNYYIVIKHRNCIDTWSRSGGETIIRGSRKNYDFTTALTQAYGNNMILKGTKYCVYSGDVNRDGLVNLTDILNVYNSSTNFQTGYVNADVTGDKVVNLSDLTLIYNNATKFVSVKKP